jgi:hypothetical protein
VGPGTSRPSPEGLLANKKVILFAKKSLRGIPPVQRAGCGAEGHPACWSDGRSPRLYKPPPAQKMSFYSAKPEKKEREERKREEEAAKPCSHVDLEVYSHSSRIIT